MPDEIAGDVHQQSRAFRLAKNGPERAEGSWPSPLWRRHEVVQFEEDPNRVGAKSRCCGEVGAHAQEVLTVGIVDVVDVRVAAVELLVEAVHPERVPAELQLCSYGAHDGRRSSGFSSRHRHRAQGQRKQAGTHETDDPLPSTCKAMRTAIRPRHG
jgi:hypothetical protein